MRWVQIAMNGGDTEHKIRRGTRGWGECVREVAMGRGVDLENEQWRETERRERRRRRNREVKKKENVRDIKEDRGDSESQYKGQTMTKNRGKRERKKDTPIRKIERTQGTKTTRDKEEEEEMWGSGAGRARGRWWRVS